MGVETNLFEHAKRWSAATFLGVASFLGPAAVAEGQAAEDAQIGTAAVGFSLNCRTTSQYIKDELLPNKEITVRVSKVGPGSEIVSLRFLETAQGQLYVDSEAEEDLRIVDRNQFENHPDGVRQSYFTQKNRVAVLRLFAEKTDGNISPKTYVDARCLSEKASTKETRKLTKPPVRTEIVAAVPK